MKKATKPSYQNCMFAAIYLILRGKADKIVAIKGDSKWWPHHYMVVNKKGHALHFNHIHPDKENRFAPWWFEGQFIGIRHSQQAKILKKTNREIKAEFGTWKGFLFLATIWILFMLPWLLVWLFYTPLWTMWGVVEALRKRFKI